MCSGAGAAPSHGIAMHGVPALAPDFSHLAYANPDAPRGGSVTFAAIGTFDSLNPLIVRGRPAAGVRDYVFESLLTRNFDEPFSLYGLIAESVETPDDRSWVEFTLNPEARFSDGVPVTVEDVVFSWRTLKSKGRPNHRSYYSKVSRVETPSGRRIRFEFESGADRELALIIGLMPVLPRHHFEHRRFDETSLDPPLGSGPYVISSVQPGASITYERNPDYWGGGLAINRGAFNFATVRYDYFRDESARFEAFKKGLYDFQHDGDPARWATSYEFPAVKDGRVLREEVSRSTPAGMRGLAFNTRRHIFADRRVRRALTLMFDFEWLNANLYHGLYARTQGYYDGSELSAVGRPASAAERALLEPYVDAVDPDVLDGTYTLESANSSGRNRAGMRAAIGLFAEAGYELKDGRMVDAASAEPFAFEILVAERRQERYALAYARMLERIGVSATVRQVDSVQYQTRRQTYDFDMVEHFWYASLSPGNEQNFYWSSRAAGEEGTRNYMGARNPGIDAMIAALLDAREREDFVTAARALDRLLISGNYVIPLFHLPGQWIAYRSRLAHPQRHSLDGYKIDTWWVEREK
jgi:peptide/nickel transport system substrate-binding protein